MRPITRLDRVDALRALALLPVLLVNMASYRSSGLDLPLLWPQPEGSALAWGLTFLVTALLQGKGIALLSLLVGYTLTLGRDPQRRARRLLVLGVVHGLFLYWGDILTAYALASLMALRHRRARLRGLLRRGTAWLSMGLLLMLLLGLVPVTGEPADRILFNAASRWDAMLANAEIYGYALLTLLVAMPFTYGLLLLGLASGRLRLLAHRRWRPLWQRLARAALPLLLLNLAMGVAVLGRQVGDGSAAIQLLTLLTLPAWVAHFLLRPTAPPRWLALAGRNTLSVYVGGSLLIVLLFSPVGLNWAAGTAACVVVALAAWAALIAFSAAAAARGRRLPLEVWMARA